MIVDVYWNVRAHCYSVRHEGRVIDHMRKVALTDARFVVHPAGRARVLRTGRKNVHAFVRGELVQLPLLQVRDADCAQVRYNPKTCETFVYSTSGVPIKAARKVWLESEVSLDAPNAARIWVRN